MVSIKAGVEHLRDKFTSLPADEFDIEHHGTIVEDALPDIIRSSGDILVNVHTKTKDNELQMHLDIQDSKLTELKQSAAATMISDIHNRRPMTGGASENRPFNRRIALPSAKERSVYSREESDGESAYGDNNIDTEDEITRNGLKKSSSILIAQEERRKLSSSNHP